MLLRPAPLNRTKLRSLDGRGKRRRHCQFFSESETETSSLAAHGELSFISREAEAAAGRAAARKDPNQNNPDRVAPSYELIELHSGCHAKRVAPFVFCGRSCDLICIIIVICPWHVACQKARGEGAATATEMQMGIIGGRRRRRRKRNSRQCCAVQRQREREEGFMP